MVLGLVRTFIVFKAGEIVKLSAKWIELRERTGITIPGIKLNEPDRMGNSFIYISTCHGNANLCIK